MKMTLVRWTPQRDWLWNTQREISRLFDDMMGQTPVGSGDQSWAPAVDIEEQEEEYLVSVDLPGLRREDVKVTVKDNVLFISGERRQERTEEQANYHLTERAYGCFRRAFTLPRTVDAGKIRANYTDGVLKVNVPKAEEAKQREINVAVK
jgi:HSP20 family protein